MKKTIRTLASLLLLTAAIPFANAATQLKVGVIDLPQIMQKAPQVQAINEKLKSQFSEQQKTIMAAQQQLQADTVKLQSGGKQISDADQKQLQDKVSNEQKGLQQMVVSFQQSVTAAQNKAIEQLMSDINGTVKSIAQKQQLDIVLLKPAVIYASDTVDITGQVINELPNK